MSVSKKSWLRGSHIGRGSFGTVYLALGSSDGRLFAVKSVDMSGVASSSALQSLEKEISFLKSISSPHIVSYLGDDTTREATGVFRNLHLEYMPGGTVTDLALGFSKVGRSMDDKSLRSYTRCAVKALNHLHSIGVVHCDVKGRNLLIGHSPMTAKLADFGSAKMVGRSRGDGASFQGTPLWMAPEVVRGEAQIPESDVWSLGCTVLEMATGMAPWREQGIDALFRIGFSDELPRFPEQMSKVGLEFLDKCLRRNWRERWTCEELLKHPFLSDDGTVGTEESPRSVFDWVSSGFESEEEEEFESRPSSSGGSLFDAKQRIGELVSSVEVGWEEDVDGWEVVREEGEMEESGEEGVAEEEIENCRGGADIDGGISGSGGDAAGHKLSHEQRQQATGSHRRKGRGGGRMSRNYLD